MPTAPSAPALTTTPIAAPVPARTPASAWVLLLTLATIWGTSFILMKKGLVVFSAMELGACRVTVAALLLLPFALKHLPQLERPRIKWLVLAGVVGTLIPAFLFAYAETKLASGLAGVLNALTAVFTLLVGALFFGQKITPLRVLGIVLGLVGTVVLMLLGGSGGAATPSGEGNAWYGLYIVLATLGYGVSVNVIKSRLHGIPPLAVTGLLLLFIGGPALAYLLVGTGFLYKLQHVAGAWKAFGYIALLATMSTAVAMVLFNKLIHQSTALFAASNTYIVPIMALAWGVLDGEAFNLWHLLGMVIILVSVAIIHRAK
ncbi:EamA-like transporter family protein [Hymenobacter daecheongensis DSM 21074]|uniref:EamA-like transporter family protein n=1 Tax=Hymenobacter daecheongensis DSM 21074 TaxID=1121955 RepID=A0A1M6IJ93_9BACT|nr:DMT family transporter [Hymenobacter daecheongensis]SHJ34540.1 EamA-like transporter family protein [Hymenobacter daecheongensis DSM 21074]